MLLGCCPVFRHALGGKCPCDVFAIFPYSDVPGDALLALVLRNRSHKTLLQIGVNLANWNKGSLHISDLQGTSVLRYKSSAFLSACIASDARMFVSSFASVSSSMMSSLLHARIIHGSAALSEEIELWLIGS